MRIILAASIKNFFSRQIISSDALKYASAAVKAHHGHLVSVAEGLNRPANGLVQAPRAWKQNQLR
jgi:hypothetical protein